MKTRWILAGGLVLIAGGAGYMAWLSRQAGDDGQWLFGVFALFFGLLAAAALRPASPTAPPAQGRATSGFAPHWWLLLGMVAIITALVAAVVTALLRR